MVHFSRLPLFADETNMTKGLVRVILIALAISLWSCQTGLCAPIQLSPAEQAWLKQHPQVHVRVSSAYPPFEFFDKGSYQGLAYDYLMLVGQRLGIEFVPVPDLTWSQSLESIRNREQVELILLITRTQEREQFLNFTHDYISFPWVIFSRRDSGFIGQISDLSGKTVAVEQGFITADWLKRDVKTVRLKEYPDSESAIEAVTLNSADAYVGNLAIGTYLIEKNGLTNLKVAGPTPYGDDPLAMGVRKDWPELAGMIDRVLLNLTEEEHQTIRQRWLSLRVEYGLRTLDIVKWVLAVLAIASIWVINLRWTVKRRTAELQKEVKLRQDKELALATQSAQMTSIFDSLEAVVYVADMETLQILYLNKYGCLQFGEDWQGHSCFEFFHIDQTSACSFCNNDELVVNGAPGPPITYEQHNEKTNRWYQCIGRAIYWPDDRLVRIEIAVDISERLEMDRMKDEMISALGHEVRTPLTAMIGYAELMIDLDLPAAQRREYLGIICQESGRLAELFDNFLNLQTIKIGKGVKNFQSVKVESILNQAIDLFKGASRKHLLKLDCQADLPEINGDADLLHRAFLNLISNAIKYSPDGGSVAVAAYRSDDSIVVKVSDEGLGIDSSAYKRIFESFYRIDNSNNRRIGGTGLGLPLVKETVSLHGGEVWVESQVGKGSSFYVSLPF